MCLEVTNRMQKTEKILFVCTIVILIAGSIGLPAAFGFYGQRHGGQTSMMQATAGQCGSYNMHQGICQYGTTNCPDQYHGMMQNYTCPYWQNGTCQFTGD
jgi:hypothetical protein